MRTDTYRRSDTYGCTPVHMMHMSTYESLIHKVQQLLYKGVMIQHPPPYRECMIPNLYIYICNIFLYIYRERDPYSVYTYIYIYIHIYAYTQKAHLVQQECILIHLKIPCVHGAFCLPSSSSVFAPVSPCAAVALNAAPQGEAMRLLRQAHWKYSTNREYQKGIPIYI